MHYLSRIIDKELATRLASTGAVVIEGPKACGKTETARRIAASEVLLDIDTNARQTVAIDPKLVHDGNSSPKAERAVFLPDPDFLALVPKKRDTNKPMDVPHISAQESYRICLVIRKYGPCHGESLIHPGFITILHT